MIHKFPGMPSKSWLVAFMKRYFDKRIVFELSPHSSMTLFLLESDFLTESAPIFVHGVFCGLMKRPKNALYPDRPSGLYLEFRKVEYVQGDVRVRTLLNSSHRDFKHRIFGFELSEVLRSSLAEKLRRALPKLMYRVED